MSHYSDLLHVERQRRHAFMALIALCQHLRWLLPTMLGFASLGCVMTLATASMAYTCIGLGACMLVWLAGLTHAGWMYLDLLSLHHERDRLERLTSLRLATQCLDYRVDWLGGPVVLERL